MGPSPGGPRRPRKAQGVPREAPGRPQGGPRKATREAPREPPGGSGGQSPIGGAPIPAPRWPPGGVSKWDAARDLNFSVRGEIVEIEVNIKDGRTTAKAFAKDVFIDQEQKLGDRRRSDTVLVLTMNYANWLTRCLEQGGCDTGVCEQNIPFAAAFALHSCSRNTKPYCRKPHAAFIYLALCRLTVRSSAPLRAPSWALMLCGLVVWMVRAE